MAHVIPDRRHTPHRHSTRHPFAHHHNEWCGPDEFRHVMEQVSDVLQVLTLENFTEFKWSFKVVAVRD